MFRHVLPLSLAGLMAVVAGCEKPATIPGTSGEPKAAPQGSEVVSKDAASDVAPARPAEEVSKPAPPPEAPKPAPAPTDVAASVAELEKLGCKLTKNGQGNVIQADCKPATLSDEQVKLLEGLPSLENLSLENAKITNDGLASVAKLPRLKVLSLRRCSRLTDDALVHLVGLESLEQLLLLYAPFTDAGMTHVAKLKSLRALDLRGCLQTGDGGLEQIKNLPNLVDLKIRSNGVTDAGLAHLAGMKLRVFEIEDANQITDAGLKNFAGMTDLTKVNFMRVRIGDSGLENFTNCKKLKDVRLRGTSIDGSGLKALHGSKGTLTYLDISETAFGSAAMDNLVPLTNLETLDMWFATIEDADLAKLAGMTKLKNLTLEQCRNLTNAGVEQIAKLPALETLNLNQTRIDDGALELLAKVPNLKSLEIKNTSVSDAAIEKLKAAKPNCEVSY
jgi:hypothetical protein